MSYTPTTWADGDPINAIPVNKIELGLQDAAAVADSAQSDAAAAQSTANTAVTNAATAQTAANNAQSTANTAVTNAATAQTAANNAQSTANTALTKANIPGSVFFKAIRNLASTNIAANAFTTYPLNAVEENVGGGTYNTSTFIYTVPVTGLYMCVGSIRMSDNAAARNVMIGIGTSNVDGTHTLWRNMGGVQRDSLQYTRIARFTAGDQVRMYIYSTTSTFPTEYSASIGNAQHMTIYLLG